MYTTVNNCGNTTTILLSRFAPTNKKVTYHFEIEKLSSKLYQIFGDDVEKLGQISQDEFGQDEWGGRKWDFGDIAFRLLCPNGHFQLYYDLKGLDQQNKES
jgi:hypothetical protein